MGPSLQVGNQFLIAVNSSNSASGVFAGYAEGATVQAGMDAFTISYMYNSDGGSIGNDVLLTLTAVPKPGTWFAGGLALASLLVLQRRRIRRADGRRA